MQTFNVGDMAKWLSEHPEAQQEILLGTFVEKEILAKMSVEVVKKTAEKMGLRFATEEEVKAYLKQMPEQPEDGNDPWQDEGRFLFRK